MKWNFNRSNGMLLAAVLALSALPWMSRASTITNGGCRQVNLVSDIPNQGLWRLTFEAAEPFEVECKFFEGDCRYFSPGTDAGADGLLGFIRPAFSGEE
jgi:hypothetical protein